MSTLEPAVVGDVVDLHLGSTTAFGIVRYIGPISGGSWPWAGIELVGPHTHLGQNSGNINGTYYFSTAVQGAGIFVPLKAAIKRPFPPPDTPITLQVCNIKPLKPRRITADGRILDPSPSPSPAKAAQPISRKAAQTSPLKASQPSARKQPQPSPRRAPQPSPTKAPQPSPRKTPQPPSREPPQQPARKLFPPAREASEATTRAWVCARCHPHIASRATRLHPPHSPSSTLTMGAEEDGHFCPQCRRHRRLAEFGSVVRDAGDGDGDDGDDRGGTETKNQASEVSVVELSGDEDVKMKGAGGGEREELEEGGEDVKVVEAPTAEGRDAEDRKGSGASQEDAIMID